MNAGSEAFTHQVQLLEAVLRTGHRMMAIRSLWRLLTESVRLICNTFDLNTVVIYLLNEDRQRLVPQARYGKWAHEIIESGEGLPIDDQSTVGQALLRHEPVYTPASLEGPNPQFHSELVLPLIHPNAARDESREGYIGALVLQAMPELFTPDDLQVYEFLADQLAVAIHNAQLYMRDAQVLASSERRVKLLEAATVVGRDVTSLLDLDTLLSRIVDTICAVYGFYYAAIFMVETKMKHWAVLRAGYGEAGRKMLEAGHVLEIADTSMIGWCINHKQARIALDVGQDAVRFNNPLLPLTRSEMALPLRLGDEVIGALSIQSAQESAFDEKDIYTLQILADQVAIVINNANLLNDLRETNRELVRTKTFEAIAQATGEAIHWVGNKAAPIPACVKRTREDMAKFIYMADALLQQAPEALRQHVFAQLLADAAATLDEHAPNGREQIAELSSQPFKQARRKLNMESILEDLDIIHMSAETILGIKENMIGPARETHRRRLRIDELLRKTVLSMALPEHIQVEQRYADNLPFVMADPRQMENVFGNLFKNAVEAMEGRPAPRLTIEAAPAQDERYLAVRVTDTGCGISKADLDRIWISFYTTKGDRGGTGLGLSSCMQIVNQMEGKIEVESEVGVGTTFTVLLPVETE